jgi:hypothetical protein
MTEAVDTVPAAGLADDNPKFVAGMASSSFRVPSKLAAAAAVVAANTAKGQTGQDSCP